MLLSAGVILNIFVNAKSSPVTITNIANVFVQIILELPPVPSVDVTMVARLGILSFLAFYVSINLNLFFEIAEDLWDNVVIFVWDLGIDFAHIVTFFYDLLIPLYNWYATLSTQLVSGTFKILAKCQIKGLVEALMFLAEAMVALAEAMAAFLQNPKGPFDITEVVSQLQLAAKGQENVLVCACDGLTPALGIVFDVFRPPILSLLLNETLNSLVGVPQTLILAVPPFMETPDAHRVFRPLGRAFGLLGEYMDDVVGRSMDRIFKGATKIQVFTPLGHTAAGVVGAVESVAHIASHLALNRKISYDPSHIHTSLVRAARSSGDVITELIGPIAEKVGLDVSPLSNTIGKVVESLVGIPGVVLGQLFFYLREDHTGLSFMETLQYMDGPYDDRSCNEGTYSTIPGEFLTDSFNPSCGRTTVQRSIVQPLEAAFDEMKDIALVFSYIPISMKLILRTLNMILRIILSGEDIVEGNFFHVPINCGYGTNEECTTTCQYFYAEDNDNPCNSQISEWVFETVNEFGDSLDSLFRAIKPHHDESWCDAENRKFPDNEERCAVSNTDFMCATGNTLKQLTGVITELLRNSYSLVITPFKEPNDTNPLRLDTVICALDKSLYAAAGNIVAVMPNSLIGNAYKEKITDLVHSFISIPVSIIRFYSIGATYMTSVITGSPVDWDAIIDSIENQLISDDNRQVKISTESSTQTVSLSDSTANFLVAELLVVSNYIINVFDAVGRILPEGNFMEGNVKILKILKNALSKEMINWVTLIFNLGANIISMFTSGNIDVTQIIEDLVTLVVKTLSLLAKIASRIIVSLLQMLGPIGDFIILIWKGICASVSILEFFGLDMGDLCDTVDEVDIGRRRLSDHVINLGKWNGTSECDMLVNHFNGHAWSELVPLEQIKIMKCEEDMLTMRGVQNITGLEFPIDMIYNWRRKYSMMYEVALGAYIYLKHENPDDMIIEWDLAGLPRYWLDMWGRITVKLPWVDIIDDALLRAVKPTPEAHSIYETAKSAASDIIIVMKEHKHTEMPSLSGLTLGSGYHKVMSRHTKAWGISTDINIDGPLNCAVLDNAYKSMNEATGRVQEYYSGYFTDRTVPIFVNWLNELDSNVVNASEYRPSRAWTLEKSSEWLKSATLYSFETCNAEDIMCDVNDMADRARRITESMWYIAYGLIFAGILSLLTGVSLFNLIFLAPLVPLAHVWNFRYTCLPNMPWCAMDDILNWIQLYRPSTWSEMFPIISKNFQTNGVDCPDHPLWASTYILAQTPIMNVIEFALFNTDYYETLIEWVSRSEKNDECIVIRGLDIAYAVSIFYILFSCWAYMTWASRVVLRVVKTFIYMASTIYSVTTE